MRTQELDNKMFSFGEALHNDHHDFSWLTGDQKWKLYSDVGPTNHSLNKRKAPIVLSEGLLYFKSSTAAVRDLNKCINESSSRTKLPTEPLVETSEPH